MFIHIMISLLTASVNYGKMTTILNIREKQKRRSRRTEA